jgi:hypothetical protein
MRHPVLMVTAGLLVVMTGCIKKDRVFEIRLSEPEFQGLFVLRVSTDNGALDLDETDQILVPGSRVVEIKSMRPLQHWHGVKAFDAAGNPIPVWAGDHIAANGLFSLQNDNNEAWYYIGPESEVQTLQKCSMDQLEEKLQQQKAGK